MSNRFLSAGDETKMHLLAGFETIEDSGNAGARGGAGFGVLPLIERIWSAAVAAAGGGGGGGGRNPGAEGRLVQKV